MLDKGLFGGFGAFGALGRRCRDVRLDRRGWVWRVGLGNGRGYGSDSGFCMWCRGGRGCRGMLRRIFVAYGVVFVI